MTTWRPTPRRRRPGRWRLWPRLDAALLVAAVGCMALGVARLHDEPDLARDAAFWAVVLVGVLAGRWLWIGTR